MNKFNIGDRFYFYRNMTDSETIKIGFKGVVDEIIELCNGRLLYCCNGYGFTDDEIKPVLKTNGSIII